MQARTDSDDLAWDRKDELWGEAIKQVRLSSFCRKVTTFAKSLYEDGAEFKSPLVIGGFNVLYPIQRPNPASPASVLVRIPVPKQPVFPEEKVSSEAATTKFLAQHSNVPVAKLLDYGIESDIGPFMVLEDLGSRRDVGDLLEKPREDMDETPVLDPDIDEERLQSLYKKMAECMLPLTRPTFPRIGALVETTPGSYEALGRPITLNMNNMVHLSNVPPSIFHPKGTTYRTADGWYTALAEMQMATLLFQHNDMVTSENDCRTKFVARRLFYNLAKDGCLSSYGFVQDDWSACSKVKKKENKTQMAMPDGSASFRLWSDDFRPVNVLVNENDDVLGAINWEWSYAAPTQFSLDPPWWLLLDVPEMWEEGIQAWADTYEKRLETWLAAMKETEKSFEQGEFELSAYMRDSWETGRFWLNYAARKSWAFDAVYWKFLDERFFGKREGNLSPEELWKARINLLSEEEKVAMESMVEIKIAESKERVLVEWDAEEARIRLSRFLTI